MAAEHARLRGEPERALALYEQAALRATRQGYPQHGGLAHERRESLLRSQRREQAALLAHARAIECYRQWGSPAVLARLSAAGADAAHTSWPSSGSPRERSS